MKRTILITIAMVLAVGIVYAQKAPQGEEYEKRKRRRGRD